MALNSILSDFSFKKQPRGKIDITAERSFLFGDGIIKGSWKELTAKRLKKGKDD